MSHLFASGGQSIGVSASTSVLPMNTFIFFSLFIILFYFNNYYLFIYLFYFTILYWFCHASTCIHHGCTCVPHPEPPSQGTGWISLSSKGLSRVLSNTKFKSINSSVLRFLYSPTLTSIHDYWKNHSPD